MDAQTVVSFVQLMNEKPELKKSKKSFKKYIDEKAKRYFNLRKAAIYKLLNEQKGKYLECYDIYEKFIQDNDTDLFDPNIDINDLVNKMVQAFGIELKDAETAYETQEKNDAQEN